LILRRAPTKIAVVLTNRRRLATLPEDRDRDRSVRTLYVFDMDDTLLASPTKIDFERVTGKLWPFERWWSVPQSLEAPLEVAPKPEIKSAYNDAVRDPAGFVIVMTGRLHTKPMLKAVQSALQRAGYPKHTPGDNLFLKNPALRDTAAWKKQMLRGFMKRFPNVEAIHMWDDRGEHVQQFETQIKELGRKSQVVLVQGLETMGSLQESRKSCLACVRKHLAQALVLAQEAQQGYPTHRWIAIGHLGEASDESVRDYPELAAEIREHRVGYMADPDYDVPFLELIEKATALAGEAVSEQMTAHERDALERCIAKGDEGCADSIVKAVRKREGLERQSLVAGKRKTAQARGLVAGRATETAAKEAFARRVKDCETKGGKMAGWRCIQQLPARRPLRTLSATA
jgi:hypothetical protein